AGAPGPLSARRAGAVVAAPPVPPAGRSLRGRGAGAGVAGGAALAAGARPVVAADLAIGMLRRAGPALHPVAADAATLPFRDGSFDLVLAALSLSHLVDLATGLGEARRVGRAIAASTFAPGWSHPARAAVEEALRPFGYRPPAWYVRLKRETEPRAEDPDQLAGLAAAAGFRRVRLRTAAVPTGLATPAQLASWRLGMANIAPFVRSLDPARPAGSRRAAEGAV